MNAPFVNIHTHSSTGEGIELVNIDNFDAPNAEFASAGLHPWNIGKCDHLQTLATIGEWCSSGQVAAVGEIGLDRSIETDIDTQKELLTKQLDIAQQFQLPVVIHCVRAYSDFLQIMGRWPRMPMIFHGFAGNATITEQLLSRGAKLSFGHKLLAERKLQDLLPTIPNDCIFLETDTKSVKIGDIYNLAATLKGISVDELKQIIFSNLIQIFGNRWTAIG